MLRIMGILAGLVWLILLGYTEWTERDMEQDGWLDEPAGDGQACEEGERHEAANRTSSDARPPASAG